MTYKTAKRKPFICDRCNMFRPRGTKYKLASRGEKICYQCEPEHVIIIHKGFYDKDPENNPKLYCNAEPGLGWSGWIVWEGGPVSPISWAKKGEYQIYCRDPLNNELSQKFDARSTFIKWRLKGWIKEYRYKLKGLMNEN